MKKIFFISWILFFTMTAYRTEAQFSAGAGVAYVTAYTQFGVQVRALYKVNETWQGNFDFNYYLDASPFFSLKEFDLNAHYVFLQKDIFSVYGLTGLNVFLKTSGAAKYTYPALNLGGGTQVAIKENIDGYFEIRYNLFGVPDQIVFSLGGLYEFE